MLNEILEYKEYSADLSEPENTIKRIKYGVITKAGKSFMGLEGMLTSISRRMLYYYGDKVEDTDRDAAEAAMKAWLGFKYRIDLPEDDERVAEIRKLEGWFPQYVRTVLIKKYFDQTALKDPEKGAELLECISSYENAETEDEKEEAIERLKELNAKISRLMNKLEYTASDTYREQLELTNYNNGISVDEHNKRRDNRDILRFEKVIANAMRRKKPRIFYLACKDNGLNTVHVTLNGNMKEMRELTSEEADTVLRFVSAYLLEYYYIEMAINKAEADDMELVMEARIPLRYVPYDNLRFSDWHTNDAYFHAERMDFRYGTRYLIRRWGDKYRSGGNKTKIKIEENWFERCEWALIDATDNDDTLDKYLEEHPGHHFYSDRGSGKLLAMDQRYVR